MTNKAKELVAGSRSYEMRFVMLPRFDMATLATMIEPLRIANYLTGEALYRWEFLTPAVQQASWLYGHSVLPIRKAAICAHASG